MGGGVEHGRGYVKGCNLFLDVFELLFQSYDIAIRHSSDVELFVLSVIEGGACISGGAEPRPTD